MTIEEQMGQRFAAARQTLGSRRREAARKLGISTRAYRAWERGQRRGWSEMCLRFGLQRQDADQRRLPDLRRSANAVHRGGDA
jgi:transcriptional regulator with XRE-family HTH domain